MAKDRQVTRRSSFITTAVEDEYDDEYVEEEEYTEPSKKVTSISKKDEMPVRNTAPVTEKAPEPIGKPEPEKAQPAFYVNGAPTYRGYSANLYSDKKLYGPYLKNRLCVYTTDAQVEQIKIQSIMSNKKLDISTVYRTGADIVLEMDDDTYSRLLAAAKSEDVSVATIVNRILKNAGY